ncbi:MAG: hypothetical protein WBV94_06935 [Blastocatellia bacterium]
MNQRNASIYEYDLFNPLRGHKLTELESYIANLLLSANSERPIDNEAIRVAVELRFQKKMDAREVKAIIRVLRKDHAFPIISRRKKPHGYWWCQSKREMEAFIETFKSQALDELHTLSRIVKENFPELAGQLKLDM